MAVAYDIKAHPTVYGARQFRSRLEAKWASFFDLAGWQFEYEPFDLEGWSPDFLLKGRGRQVLVEVKPISEPDEDTQRKMERAANAAKWDGDLMLVGVAPLFALGFGPYESAAIGWLAERVTINDKPMISWARASAYVPALKAEDYVPGQGWVVDFMHAEMSWGGRMHGLGFREGKWPPKGDWLKRAWDRAANRVQWKKA
jgi:hypothetical protein